jgi:hypothetical protein
MSIRNETPRNAAAGQCHRFEPKGCSRCSRLICSTVSRTRQIMAPNQSATMTGPKTSTPKASAAHPHRFSRPQEGSSSSAG